MPTAHPDIIGVITTSGGLTLVQNETLRRWLRLMAPKEVHLGMRAKGDLDVHDICITLPQRPRLVGHPGWYMNSEEEDRMEARPEDNWECDTVLTRRSTYYRDKDIIDASEFVVVAPSRAGDLVLLMGWEPIRHMRYIGRPGFAVLPDGSTWWV